MKAVILAAGYATRMYPLTKNFPKSLLPIGHATILDYIVEKIDQVADINEIIIVTNHSFYAHFSEWMYDCYSENKITILDDGTTENENRLGAIRDLSYAVQEGHITEDLLVLAGDNLFDFSLQEMVNYYHKVKCDCIATHVLTDLRALQRTGVVTIDEHRRVIQFEEKPEHPQSNLAVPPFYIYTADTVVNQLPAYIREMSGVEKDKWDAPGNLIPYLVKHSQVYAYPLKGKRYDIGNLESYEKVKEMYRGTEDAALSNADT